MINIYNHVPTVYLKASRDFQYLSWLVNIVLNSVKHNVDDLYDLPISKADPRLTELLAMTLGFKVKRNYDKDQLATLVSIIPKILKYKGTEKAIRLAGEALLRTSGATGRFDVTNDGNTVEVLLPKNLVDITLFMDLMPYILPAGMTCRVIRKTELQDTPVTEIGIETSIPIAHMQKDVEFNVDTQQISGMSVIYETNTKAPNFTNYDADENINTGLLDNNIIPALENPMGDFA